ncbi:MAG: GTP-binding protein [Fibrobacterota bacterium]
MESDKIRNIGIIAHVDAGKTTLSEQILLHGGAIRSVGKVDDGMTTMDYLRQEQLRGITIRAGVASFEWKGKQINFVDTPGHIDFSLEVERSLRVLDGAIAVFCGVRGVEPRTKAVWALADKFDVPRVGWINKLDMPGADFAGTILEIEEAFAITAIPVDWPVVKDGVVVGAVDLIEWTARELREHQSRKLSAIPADWLAFAEPARERLLEEASKDDEALMEQILSNAVDPATLIQAIARGCKSGRLLPITGGSALRGWNSATVLDSVVRYLPSPSVPKGLEDHPGAGLVFQTSRGEENRRVVVTRLFAGTVRSGGLIKKAHSDDPPDTIGRIFKVFADDLKETDFAQAGEIVALEVGQQWRTGDTILAEGGQEVRFEADHRARLVLELALEAASEEDHRLLRIGLEHLAEEDSGIEWSEEAETGRCTLRGQGELQLEVALEMLREAHTPSFKAWPPHVRRRERLRESVGPMKEKAEWAGQWLEIEAKVEPADDGTTIHWAGEVPEGIRAAAEAGIREAMGNGHSGHGSLDGAIWTLSICGKSEAPPAALGKKILDHLGPEILKSAGIITEIPATKALIQTPDEHLGAILAALQSKGVEIQAIDTQRNGSTIKAFSPLEPLLGCVTLFRSLSKGQALVSLDPNGWVVESA